jgi:hypothetical protein
MTELANNLISLVNVIIDVEPEVLVSVASSRTVPTAFAASIKLLQLL